EGAIDMFTEGWDVQLVDLARVRAAQPTIYVDDAVDRVREGDPEDPTSIAEIALPLPTQTQLPAQYDPVRQAWMLSSPNPNLRITGNFAGEVQPHVTGFGFAVRILPSFLQVAVVDGKHVLRDGYHRAYGFLACGISHVPAFVREYRGPDEVGLPPGMLAQAAYL